MKCPVCETEYTPNEVETCSVCGYDLTPYPPVIGGIPSGFLEKEKKRIAAAKRVWQLSQSQVKSAQLMISHLQSQLDEMTQQIDSYTQSQNQLKADFQSQFDSLVERIDRLSKEQNQQQLMNLQFRRKITQKIESLNQSQSRLKSQVEEIKDQLQPMVEEVQENPIVSSSSGFDYTQLDRLLKSGNWLDAEIKTEEIMLEVAGRKPRGCLDDDDIKNFPCEDLQIIDGLWVKHSNGHFGFSVQKQIYSKLDEQPNNYRIHQFLNEVGWFSVRFDELKFSLFGAPRGHLPILYNYIEERNRFTKVGERPYFNGDTYLTLMLSIAQKLVA